MKKMSLMALLVVAGFVAGAQRTEFGLKGGLNLATWSNNNDSRGYQNRTGLHAGLLARVHAGPNIAVQPEVVYSQQGTRYTSGNQGHNLRLDYINVPVMVQAKVGGGFYGQVGPQIGFLMSTTDRVNNVETGFFSNSDFKRTDVGVGFGLGYAGASPIGLDARYNLGLTNINAAGNNNIRNNVLQVGLTYRLGGAQGRRF